VTDAIYKGELSGHGYMGFTISYSLPLNATNDGDAEKAALRWANGQLRQWPPGEALTLSVKNGRDTMKRIKITVKTDAHRT
jgi:hypothetical protein